MQCPNCQELTPDTNYKCPHCGVVLKEGIEPQDFYRAPEEKKALSPAHLILVVLGLAVLLIGAFWIMQKKDDGKKVSASQQLKQLAQKVTPRERDVTPTETVAQDSAPEQVTGEAAGTDDFDDGGDDLDEWDGETSYDLADFSHTPGEKINIEPWIQKGKTTIFDFYSEYCGPCREISPKLRELDEKRDDIVVIKIDINRGEVTGGIDWKSPVAQQYKLARIPYFRIYNPQGKLSHDGYAARLAIEQMFKDESIL